jgi:amino acid permease
MNFNFLLNFQPDFILPGLGVIVPWVLTAVVNISFALAVWNDSRHLAALLHRRTFFVSGGIWALATLVSGVFAAAIYWLIHHSTLRPQPIPSDSAQAAAPERPAPPKAEA